jgi:hypothetical protein
MDFLLLIYCAVPAEMRGGPKPYTADLYRLQSCGKPHTGIGALTEPQCSHHVLSEQSLTTQPSTPSSYLTLISMSPILTLPIHGTKMQGLD